MPAIDDMPRCALRPYRSSATSSASARGKRWGLSGGTARSRRGLDLGGTRLQRRRAPPAEGRRRLVRTILICQSALIGARMNGARRRKAWVLSPSGYEPPRGPWPRRGEAPYQTDNECRPAKPRRGGSTPAPGREPGEGQRARPSAGHGPIASRLHELPDASMTAQFEITLRVAAHASASRVRRHQCTRVRGRTRR